MYYCSQFFSFIVEMKKHSSDLLPKPMDIVGDEETPRPVQRKAKPKKKTEKKPEKKTWSREEILSTFLPPEKQKSLHKPRREKENPKTTEKPKKEKKPVPKVIMKEGKPEETKQPLNDGNIFQR